MASGNSTGAIWWIYDCFYQRDYLLPEVIIKNGDFYWSTIILALLVFHSREVRTCSPTRVWVRGEVATCAR